MSLRRDGKRKDTGKQRWRCTSSDGVHCYGTTNPNADYRGPDGRPRKAKARMFEFKRPLRGATEFVITCAQNATPVHEGFLKSLLALCDERSAMFMPVPILYKNPTSVWTESQDNTAVWAEELRPFLYSQRVRLGKNLILLGDISSQPTTVNPLMGFESVTHGESGILAHPKLQLKTVASPMDRWPKLFTTTGAITLKNNYSRTPTGKRGSFHHSFGAVLVQLTHGGRRFHIHQLNPRDDGAFIFMDRAYYPDGKIEKAPRSMAAIFGDLHNQFKDPVVIEATFGKGGLVETIDPEIQIFHDLLDSYSVSPHHVGNPFIQAAKIKGDMHRMRAEVESAIEWVKSVSKTRPSFLVASNHDDMFNRWLRREDWRDIAAQHPDNAEFYLETALHVLKSARMSPIGAEYLDAFQFWVERLTTAKDNVRCLNPRESFQVAGVELSLHGDKGPNGARGTIKNLRRSGVKIMTGHGHSPAIDEDHWRVGTSTRLMAEYTFGLGGWLNTHGSIDGFGKRHLHTIIHGEFRA